MRMSPFFCLLLIPFLLCATPEKEPTLSITSLDDTSCELRINIPLAEKDALYADMLSFSFDYPGITLSEWHTAPEPVSKFDTHFKQTKKIFTGPFSISLKASYAQLPQEEVTLHMASFSHTTQKSQEHLFPLSFGTPSTPTPEMREKKEEKEVVQAPHEQPITPQKPLSLQQKLSSFFTTTESWALRLLLAFLLGILLSLTPCIYPMIPITIGILQSQASKSLGRNFCSALAYVMGIATTFAALGTAAALSGKMFGSIMQSPFVIILIVLLLAYFAGSMIGLYDLYLPRFMQSNQKTLSSSSLISIFLFGVVSGTVASPCLSPGLVLLLSLVTATGSIPLGLALLFVFGLGLGMPLLIIGTFSSSLAVLPTAGQWMVDIKQFFGFIMLGACLYFLAQIIPLYIIAWSSAVLSCGIGMFYFIAANKAHSRAARFIKNSLGILFVALSVYLVFEAYKQTDLHQHGMPHQPAWLHDYKQARTVAQSEHKKMIIDISAPYCSLCKAIDTKIFADSGVQKKLKEFIVVKIEDIDADETTQEVQNKFAIVGAPTLLIYDPETDQELKRWGGELYDLTPQEFIETL